MDYGLPVWLAWGILHVMSVYVATKSRMLAGICWNWSNLFESAQCLPMWTDAVWLHMISALWRPTLSYTIHQYPSITSTYIDNVYSYLSPFNHAHRSVEISSVSQSAMAKKPQKARAKVAAHPKEAAAKKAEAAAKKISLVDQKRWPSGDAVD